MQKIITDWAPSSATSSWKSVTELLVANLIVIIAKKAFELTPGRSELFQTTNMISLATWCRIIPRTRWR